VAKNATLQDSYFTYNTDDGILWSTYSSTYNILLGVLLGEGVGLMWTWSLFLRWSRIDEFVLGLKSVDELCHSTPMAPMGISSAETSQPPKGEICIDKSH
jgi:hypothetical protein